MPDGKRQHTLREKMDQLVSLLFAEKVLGFDVAAARKYGEIFAARHRAGRPIQAIDAQIVAIASVHGASLATRNIRDFKDCGVVLINPWQPPVA
jgi:predicted nucleic acid-binding protein